VVGRQQRYAIGVRVLATPVRLPVVPIGTESSEPATTGLQPDLTSRQWQILDTYIAPMRLGRPVPGTHNEVADRLGWSMGTVRAECAGIWNQFVLAGVPMRDYPDKRDAVVDAAVRHRLLP
jgi:hypothetical protein